MEVRFVDEADWCLGWIVAEPAFLRRASHALVADGKVWLVDPVDGDGVEERVRALGEPAGVLQLLDRHERDGPALAARLGVPRHEMPFDGLPGTPFQVIRIARNRLWREVALWWPERRALVCAEALGTARYYRAPEDRLAVHPALRLTPPRGLRGLVPRHIFVGHGEGIHGDDADAVLREALATSRRRIPSWLTAAAKAHRPGGRRSR